MSKDPANLKEYLHLLELELLDCTNNSFYREEDLAYIRGQISMLKEIMKDLYETLKANEDDFDRGAGKYIIEDFLNGIK